MENNLRGGRETSGEHVMPAQEKNLVWVMERVPSERFPYRLTIQTEAGRVILALRVQDRWPGSRGNIFCIRDEGRSGLPEPLEEVERVPVVSFKRYGHRVSVVLQRASCRKCDFLFLKKSYKTKSGFYEQIFWQTEQALRERRPRVKLSIRGSPALEILIDRNERYPWRFPGCRVERESLPAGDYALLGNGVIQAVVERKTYSDLLAAFGILPSFHQRLNEMESYPRAALVIEAHYADFLNPSRNRFYSISFTTQAIAEIYALHPHLQVVFAGNRKLAN